MSDNYHIQESDLKCPYCDHVFTEPHEVIDDEFWTKQVVKCPDCSKEFKAEMEICYTTNADCELNNIKHDLEETHIKGFFTCNNCEYCEHQVFEIVDAR